MPRRGTGMSWELQHLDLRGGASPVADDGAPVHVVWWWDALPVGSGAYLPAELPLGEDQLRDLAARFAAEQLATRVPALGGAPAADGHGRPLIEPALEAARGFDDFAAMDALAAPAQADASALAVIVCTRDRPQALATCLAALGAQHRPPGEILVVDNSCDGNARAVAAARPGVRWLHEPRPGLSVARNAGLRAARLPLVAFTDDDTRAHPNWTAELADAFQRHPEADAVTGLVLPAALDTEAERFFQFDMGGFGSRHVPVRFDRRFFSAARSPVPRVWHIGAGANMAFRRAVFERVGGFDERLGAGAAGCSEDSELWYRILAAGGVCLYEPRAVVDHHHRADWHSLRTQMRAYMRGHVAALLIQHARFGHRGNLWRALWQLPRYFIETGLRLPFRRARAPRAVVLWEEVRGWAAGLACALRPGGRRARSY